MAYFKIILVKDVRGGVAVLTGKQPSWLGSNGSSWSMIETQHVGTRYHFSSQERLHVCVCDDARVHHRGDTDHFIPATFSVSTSFLSLWFSDCRSFVRCSAWLSWASSSASSSLLPSWNSSSSSWASWKLCAHRKKLREFRQLGRVWKPAGKNCCTSSFFYLSTVPLTSYCRYD